MQSFSNKSSFTPLEPKGFLTGFTLTPLRKMLHIFSRGKSVSSIKQTTSFTLIELLIVIGILAILTAAVVIVLNPTELLKQGRDSTRMTDLASLSKTIQLLLTQNPSLSLGTASTVYISLPDTSSTCTNLSLPTLPAGYTYHCVPTASSTLLNSFGWLPIDFTSSIQSLPRLPIDPTNTSSTGLYYTYTPNTSGHYHITAQLESNKYASKASTDGGLDPAQYDIGTNLSLTPFTHGLVGYWTLDETSGSIAQDWSGYGNTLTAGALGSSASWSSGKIENSFQLLASAKTNTTPCPIGLSTSIAPSNILYTLPQNNFSISLWGNLSAGGALFHLYTQYSYPASFTGIWGRDVAIEVANSLSQYTPLAGIVVPKDSIWHHIVYVFNINDSTQSLYIDGIKTKTVQNLSANYGNSSSIHFGTYDVNWCGAGHALVGLLDDIRIYRRALRDDEIVGLYNVYK